MKHYKNPFTGNKLTSISLKKKNSILQLCYAWQKYGETLRNIYCVHVALFENVINTTSPPLISKTTFRNEPFLSLFTTCSTPAEETAFTALKGHVARCVIEASGTKCIRIQYFKKGLKSGLIIKSCAVTAAV